MGDGDGGERGQHPQHRGHRAPVVEQGPQDNEHHALRPLHEAHLALADEGFGAGARVADHQRGHHHEGHKHHVAEAVDPTVVDQQTEEQHHIRVAVDHRVEEGAEDGDQVVAAGHAAVHHVEDAGAEDHQACVEKHAAGVGGVGVAKQKRGHDVDDQADEREHVGGDAGERQAMHNVVEKPAAGAAESAGPGHSNLPCSSVPGEAAAPFSVPSSSASS